MKGIMRWCCFVICFFYIIFVWENKECVIIPKRVYFLTGALLLGKAKLVTDKRPFQKGLFPLEYISYLMHVKEQINPDNKPLTVLCGAQGVDFSTFLLATNAQKGYFVSFYDGLCVADLKPLENPRFITHIKEAQKNVLEKKDDGFGDAMDLFYRNYCAHKYASLYTKYSCIKTKEQLVAACALELDAMGVDLITVDEDEGYPRIQFMWQYHNDRKKRYSITLIHANITTPSSYPPKLLRILSKTGCGHEDGVDVYFQKAGQDIPSFYGRFIPFLYHYMNSEAFFVTDDVHNLGVFGEYCVHGNLFFPFDLPVKNTGQMRRMIREILIEWLGCNPNEMFIDPKYYYGVCFTIRQKKSGPWVINKDTYNVRFVRVKDDGFESFDLSAYQRIIRIFDVNV